MTINDRQTLATIIQNFEKNVERLNNLVLVYQDTKIGAGRNTTHRSDLLRAVVIFNHASLEDFLRNVWVWLLPSMESEKLAQIPLKGTSPKERRTKFDFSELSKYKGQPVEKIIHESIEEYSNQISFNRIEDIINTLKEIGLEFSGEEKKQFGLLSKMIRRRHHIVHQADREEAKGKGYHRIKSISLTEVLRWKKVVENFVLLVHKKIITK